ncbi:hypothetical protein [Streptomyces sp. V4I2]|uniref:hypothetical protein n=1 Tax=Streptomyces sp. V4I2 TaxID=3042280 RepID=UPI002781F626|nr:hypothetical protein [Streptomyces sp. V4I2]MDQ1044311.1 hypothetical protein [Streptomyces sp. V4I2]
MAYAIAALYATFLVETFAIARIGVRVVSPERPVTRGVRYSGALLGHMAHDRYVRETAGRLPSVQPAVDSA